MKRVKKTVPVRKGTKRTYYCPHCKQEASWETLLAAEMLLLSWAGGAGEKEVQEGEEGQEEQARLRHYALNRTGPV